MSKICPVCKTIYSDSDKFCSKCEGLEGMPVRLVDDLPLSPAGVSIGNHANIMGGVHSTVTDSHNTYTESRVINNINYAAQKSEVEIFDEKRSVFLAECKRAYEDNILNQTEKIALEECRIRLGLDEDIAADILDSVRRLSNKSTRKTSLAPIAKSRLKLLYQSLQDNDVTALRNQIHSLEETVKKYANEELACKYYLVAAVLEPEVCTDWCKAYDSELESKIAENYWRSYWSYLALLKIKLYWDRDRDDRVNRLYEKMDLFTDYSVDNLTILAIAGSLMEGKEDEAREFLGAIKGDYSPELQHLVDSIYLILCPEVAENMGVDENVCAFYLVNMFGLPDPKLKAAEKKAKEDAERKTREIAEKKAKEEAVRKAKVEAELKAKAEAEQRKIEEARKKAEEEARKKAIEEDSDYAVCVDKITNTIQAMLTARSLFGWKSADFRKNTGIIPFIASTVRGKSKAEEMVSALNNGGFFSYIEGPTDPHGNSENANSVLLQNV